MTCGQDSQVPLFATCDRDFALEFQTCGSPINKNKKIIKRENTKRCKLNSINLKRVAYILYLKRVCLL